jgi:1,4-alpha-glucan branching enzyme
MIRQTTFFLLALLASTVTGQVVTWTPLFPTRQDTITVIFDATEGTGGLVGASSVYAHTGVITDQSDSPSAWRYVKTSWGENTSDTRLTSLGNDLWELAFHIESYYGVPSNETIRQLAFVFRNADASKTGKEVGEQDIFIPVYQTSTQVRLIAPVRTPVFVDQNENQELIAVGSGIDSLALYQGDNLLLSSDQDTLRVDWQMETAGVYAFTLYGYDASEVVSEFTFEIIVNPPLSTRPLPSGADPGINILSDSQAILALYAPGKRFAYLIGDFNDWTPTAEHFMNRTPNGDTFWIEVSNLDPDLEYRYQYFVEGETRLADPYARKILDPYNDPQIDPQTYPDLIEYPEEQTTGIVSVVQTGQTPYAWEVETFKRPDPENLVIYELLLRDFLKEHSFQALTDTLTYFKRLGVNAIELMPFNEFEGNDSWGYNPSFYFAPDKYYGPAHTVKRFIDQAHKHGIAVIQDIVLQHAYGQCPLVQLYANEPEKSPWFNVTAPHTDFSWGFDFDHQSLATQRFVDRVVRYWLTEFRVDGFRFDFTRGFTNRSGGSGAFDATRIDILKRMADQMWQVDSTAYVILEHLVDDNREMKELADYGMLLWGNMNHPYNEATMGYHGGGKSNLSGASYKARGWNSPHLVAYMESHDEERLMVKNLKYGRQEGDYNIRDLGTALDRIELAATFFFTIPGPKMIWQFGELGYDYSIDYNGRLGRKPIRWDYLDEPDRRALFNTFRNLIRLKTLHPALSTTDFDLNVWGSMKQITLNHDSMDVVVAGNFGVTRDSLNLSFTQQGTWYDYFSGDSLQITQTDTLITLAAGGYRLYTDKRLAGPELYTRVESRSDPIPHSSQLYPAYPNPFNTSTRFSFRVEEQSDMVFQIINIRGQVIRQWSRTQIAPGQHRIHWDGSDESGQTVPSGIYFTRLHLDQSIHRGKCVLIK